MLVVYDVSSLGPPRYLHVTQGKAKAKLLASLSSSLAQTRKYVGSEVGRVLVDTSGLQKGVNNGRVFLGGLVCVVPFKERVS